MNPMTFDALVASAAALGASDIHLRAGQPPLLRLHGELKRANDVGALSADADELVAEC